MKHHLIGQHHQLCRHIEKQSPDTLTLQLKSTRNKRKCISGDRTLKVMTEQVQSYLCRGDSEAWAIIRARMCFPAQLQQLLYVTDCPQNFISHLLKCWSFIVGTQRLCCTPLTFCILLMMLFLYKIKEQTKLQHYKCISTQLGNCLWNSLFLDVLVLVCLQVLTVLVFLHLHAAVINPLDTAQATHLLVNTQILQRTFFWKTTVRHHGHQSGLHLHLADSFIQGFLQLHLHTVTNLGFSIWLSDSINYK